MFGKSVLQLAVIESYRYLIIGLGWTNFLRHFLQRFQFFDTDEIELVDKVVKVFIAGIHMGFSSKCDDSIEMMNVYVNEHTKKTSQYFTTHGYKILWERRVNTRRKRLFIIDLTFNPVH